MDFDRYMEDMNLFGLEYVLINDEEIIDRMYYTLLAVGSQVGMSFISIEDLIEDYDTG